VVATSAAMVLMIGVGGWLLLDNLAKQDAARRPPPSSTAPAQTSGPTATGRPPTPSRTPVPTVTVTVTPPVPEVRLVLPSPFVIAVEGGDGGSSWVTAVGGILGGAGAMGLVLVQAFAYWRRHYPQDAVSPDDDIG
jgi:hypothetical protein